MSKIIGYCNNCACKVTAENIGSMVIAASGQWCNKPKCKQTATRWQKKYLASNGVH